MRKILYFVFVMLTIIACNNREAELEQMISGDDVIFDAAPVSYHILIKDKAGVDLLDTTKTDAFVKRLEISYNDQLYPLEKFENIWGKYYTRVCPPSYFGLYLTKYYSYNTFKLTGDWCMIFGEFDGFDKVEKREIILTIDKSKVYKLGYSNEITRDSNNHTSIIRNYYFNDQLLTDESGLRGRLNFVYTDTGELEYIPMEYK